MNNEDYWKKRAEEREAEWTKKSKDTIEKELAKYYGQALSRINDDIAVLYGRYAKDNNLTYAEASKLLTGKEFKQWRMSLEEYLDAIDKTGDNKLLLELNTLAMRKRISRLDKLYADTNLCKLLSQSLSSISRPHWLLYVSRSLRMFWSFNSDACDIAVYKVSIIRMGRDVSRFICQVLLRLRKNSKILEMTGYANAV